MIRKIKKSVPGYMKRDRIEKVRSIHNAQDIMGLDDDKNEWDDKSALSALHETKKKKKKNKENVMSIDDLGALGLNTSVPRTPPKTKEKPKIKQADLDAINRLLN